VLAAFEDRSEDEHRKAATIPRRLSRKPMTASDDNAR
jgi:hypothetical protein